MSLLLFFIVEEAVSFQRTETTDEARWSLLERKTQELRACQAFALFREYGIEPILIKGFAAARYYPESKSRASVDIDIAVSSDDFEAAKAVAASANADGLAIDLHRELRHLDMLEWNDLFENSQLLEFESGTIRVLRTEDHLRVLIVHWLTDGGSYKDRLWDIYYMVENRPHDFDWDRFLNSVSRGRRRWLTCTIGLAQRYLGLNIDDTPIKDEARDLPAWLVKTVEREWASDTKLWPLELCLNDPTMLFIQIKKRVPPNPIWATVSMEGSFDAKTRVFYQIGNTLKRIIPSYHRVSATLKHK